MSAALVWKWRVMIHLCSENREKKDVNKTFRHIIGLKWRSLPSICWRNWYVLQPIPRNWNIRLNFDWFNSEKDLSIFLLSQTFMTDVKGVECRTNFDVFFLAVSIVISNNIPRHPISEANIWNFGDKFVELGVISLLNNAETAAALRRQQWSRYTAALRPEIDD
jgi:hypothetical protein